MPHFQTQGQHRGNVGFADAAEEGHVARFGVGHEHLIRALRRERAPKAVPQLQGLAVLRELHALRERQPMRIVRKCGIEVLADEAFEAGPVAGGRCGAGGACECRAAGENHGHRSGLRK